VETGYLKKRADGRKGKRRRVSNKLGIWWHVVAYRLPENEWGEFRENKGNGRCRIGL